MSGGGGELDLMQRRRQLIGMQIGGLPGAYRRIEYLESTGTQYIDTLVNLSANDFYVEVDFSPTATSTYEQALISIWKRPDNYWNLFLTKSSNLVDVYTSDHNYPTGHKVNVEARCVVTLTRKGNEWTATQDGIAKTWTYIPNVVNETTVKLFTRGDTPGISSSNTHARIYNAKIKVLDVLTSDFIPCIRKSDNKPGMYDTVTKAFFTNAGTGEFIVPN